MNRARHQQMEDLFFNTYQRMGGTLDRENYQITKDHFFRPIFAATGKKYPLDWKMSDFVNMPMDPQMAIILRAGIELFE